MTDGNENDIRSTDFKRDELPKMTKYITAAVIFYGNIALGCAFNTYGPTITTMENKYDVDSATISKVFTILTICYMVGALLGGIIFNYVNRQLAVIVMVCGMSAAAFVTPHCPTLTTFFVSAALMGIVCGAYDTAQFVWIMEMMQKNCPPYVQSQHFFYAVGANLASLLMAPFLDEGNNDDPSSKINSGLSNHELESNHAVRFNITTRKSDNSAAKLILPFSIVGAVVFLHAILQILMFTFLRYYPPPPEDIQVREDTTGKVSIHKSKSDSTIFGYKIWSARKARMVLLSAGFYAAYQAMEMCTFQFFPKFGQKSDIHLEESEAAYVLTGMTAAFAVGRGIGIIIVFRISTQLILCGNLALVLVGNILLVSVATGSLPALWSASIIFGLGLSTIYASFGGYIERYLNFTNFIASLMLVFGSGISSIYPLIVGNFIDENPVVLSYVIFFSIVVLICSLAILSYLTHRDKTRY